MWGNGAAVLPGSTGLLSARAGAHQGGGSARRFAYRDGVPPIYDLRTGLALGAEALARFAPAGFGPEVRFAQATSLGFGVDRELAAVQAALRPAEQFPVNLYAAINVSPETLP